MTFTHLLHPEIPKIKQVNINGVRHYDTPDGTLISITSLLKNFTPQGILDWRKAVGAEKANEVMRAAGDRGSKVHKISLVSFGNLKCILEPSITSFILVDF